METNESDNENITYMEVERKAEETYERGRYGDGCNRLCDDGQRDDEGRSRLIRVSHFMCLIPCLVLLYNFIFVLPKWNNIFDYTTGGVYFWMVFWMVTSISLAIVLKLIPKYDPAFMLGLFGAVLVLCLFNDLSESQSKYILRFVKATKVS